MIADLYFPSLRYVRCGRPRLRALHYAWPEMAVTPAGPIFKRWQPALYTDTNTTLAYFTDQSRSQFNWWHVAVAWNGSSNTFAAYQNGVLWSTNTLGASFLEVGDKSPGWICLGALQHSGTPEWGDDNYPNAGWFKGKLADIRIYNRELSAGEIAAVYSLSGTGAAADDEPPAGATVKGRMGGKVKVGGKGRF